MPTALTPYDTGERCEAKPWIPCGTKVSEVTPAEDFGKVDFEDDAGNTVLNIYVAQDQPGCYQVHVSPFGDEPLDLVVHGGDGNAALTFADAEELLGIIEAYRHAMRVQHSVDAEVLADYNRAHLLAAKVLRVLSGDATRTVA